MAELTDEQKAERTLELLLRPTNANASSININAGGVGVWIATTACCVMMAMNLFLLFSVFNQDRRIERLEDYITSMFTQAPYLKDIANAGSKKD